MDEEPDASSSSAPTFPGATPSGGTDAATASFGARPSGVEAHGDELYVTDSDNHRVQARRARPAAPRPAQPAAPPSAGIRSVFAPDPRPSQQGRLRFARAFGGEGNSCVLGA